MGARSHAALTALLERPDGLICALGNDGFRIPLPGSLVVAEHRQFPVPVDRATMLDLVVPEDGLTMVAAWETARTSGVAYATVHLRPEPQRPLTLTLVDARPTHGVLIGALTEQTDEDAPSRNSELGGSLAIPLRPRTATIYKSALGVITGIDDRTTRMLGWTQSQMVGIRSTEFLHPDDQERAVASWLEMLSKQHSMRVRVRHRSADGSWLWVECENIYQAAKDPADALVVTQLSDISDEMATHAALDRRERLLQRVAESVPVGLMQIASDKSLVYANARISAMLGIPKVESWEQFLAAVVAVDRQPLSAALEHALAGNSGSELEVTIQPPLSGETRICSFSLVALSDREGIPGALLCLTDITDSARLREALRVQATFDVLTGCHNRASIMAVLDKELASANERLAAVIFIDLDKFKGVNDRYGHAIGDELLIQAGARLASVLRRDDTVGRIGGDEFLLVSSGLTSSDAAMALAERVRDALQRPVLTPAGPIDMSASIGVACSGPGMDSATLTRHADLAMYKSKRQAQGRPVLYSSPTRPHQSPSRNASAKRAA